MKEGKETTVGEFHIEYIKYREGIRERSTVMADDLALRKLIEHLPEGSRTPMPGVRPRHGDTFCSEWSKKLKATSVVNHYRHLHSAFNVAKTWEYIEDNPFAKVKPPRVYKKPPKFIPVDKIGEFLCGIEDYDLRLLIAAYLATGRRRCEILNLKWSDINWDKGEYRVHVTKTHQDMTFKIGDIFRDILIEQQVFWGHRKHVFPRWKNPDSVSHRVKAALVKGGYPNLRLHSLRHSFASAFVECEGNIYTLMKLMGHSNVSTTMIYAHLTQNHLAEEVNRVKF